MAMSNKLRDRLYFYTSMGGLGFSQDETEILRRAQIVLRTWASRECGDDHGAIERDEKTGKPYYVNANSGRRHPTPDREKGALRRVEAVMAKHPGLVAYHQTDPRGCSLYVLRRDQVEGHDISSIYNRGFGVCI